jgi:hypothetical protein
VLTLFYCWIEYMTFYRCQMSMNNWETIEFENKQTAFVNPSPSK